MLRLDDVTFSYNRHSTAIRGVTADFTPGISLLMGANGSGKTTLLRLMATLLLPTRGEVSIDGVSTAKRLPQTLRRVFFLPDDFVSPFPTVTAMVERHACFYPGFNLEALGANLGEFGLRGNERLKDLSLGLRRKSLVAYALALGVDYLLLDEPSNGLDIDSKKRLRRMVARSVTDDQCIVVATHNVHDLDPMFDRLLFMAGGRIDLAVQLHELTRRIAFITSAAPVAGAAYQEPAGGAFHAVVANEDGRDTAIDFPLLYSALMSPNGPSLISYINGDEF